MLGKSIAQILRLSGVIYMIKLATQIIKKLPENINRFQISTELEQFLKANKNFESYNDINSESVELAKNYVFYRYFNFFPKLSQ
jgi:hypothetical protein